MTEPLANPLCRSARARWSSRALIVLWLVAIAAGWWCLADYSIAVNAPLDVAPVQYWPAQSTIARQHGESTLLLFLHPKCPCSQATLTELDRLLTSLKQSSVRLPQLVVVSTVPIPANDSWLHTATTQRAEQLPNAKLFVDPAGREASRFGAATSGLVMLFDQNGMRKFAGGVTEARGHEGSNVGSELLTEILRGERVDSHEIPAFGCRLCLPKSPMTRRPIEYTTHQAPVTRSKPASPDDRHVTS
jgi:hypothetical protein